MQIRKRNRPRRPDLRLPSASTDGSFSVFDECCFVIDSIAAKADQNKHRARWSASLLTASTALVPVSLIVAEQFSAGSVSAFLFGRLFPGGLAALAAILSRWIQIEKPHQRWTLYRSWHRYFEAERLRYQQRIGLYTGDDRDDKLAETLASGQLELDSDWASLVPRSRALAEASQGSQ